MAKILLIRHGHVEGIKPERFRGRANVPLTDRGTAEAKAVAQHIASTWHPTKVYTSPMKRCVDTGGAIAQACHVDSEVLTNLFDIDYGLWQWRSYEEVQQTEPQLFSLWFSTPQFMRFPEGESLQELVARGADASSIIPTTQSFSSGTIALTERCCCNSWTNRYPPIGDLRRSPAASMRSRSPRGGSALFA